MCLQSNHHLGIYQRHVWPGGLWEKKSPSVLKSCTIVCKGDANTSHTSFISSLSSYRESNGENYWSDSSWEWKSHPVATWQIQRAVSELSAHSAHCAKSAITKERGQNEMMSNALINCQHNICPDKGKIRSLCAKSNERIWYLCTATWRKAMITKTWY